MNISHTVHPDNGFSNYNDWMNYITFNNLMVRQREVVRMKTEIEFQKLKSNG